MTKGPRGGRRAGSGRPPNDAAGRGRAVNVYLTPTELAHVEQLGDGSAPAGIRKLVAASLKRKRTANQ